MFSNVKAALIVLIVIIFFACLLLLLWYHHHHSYSHRLYVSLFRWSVISQGCDDRTEEELGVAPPGHDKATIAKSRFDWVRCYLSEEGHKYNDVDLEINEEAYQRLIESE